jgi:hypothetical protein
MFDRQAGIGNDSSQRAATDLLVVRDNDSREGFIAAKHHVTAPLPAEYESSALQRSPHVASGKIGGQLGHRMYSRFSASLQE